MRRGLSVNCSCSYWRTQIDSTLGLTSRGTEGRTIPEQAHRNPNLLLLWEGGGVRYQISL